MVHDGSTVAVTVVYNLVGGLEHEFYDFPYIGNFIIPTDFHMFQRVGTPPNRKSFVKCGFSIARLDYWMSYMFIYMTL